MPILAIDDQGQIYEASPDRPDGKGYKGHAAQVGQSDLTLGNAYLKSACELRNRVLEEKRNQADIEIVERRERNKQREILQKKRDLAMNEDELMRNDLYQRNRVRAAVQMGCKCSPSTALSGDGLTANGRKGWDGMNRDQQAIHHHLTGMGTNTAHPVDPIEAYQKQLESQVSNMVAYDARKLAIRNDQEARQQKLEHDIRSGKVRRKTPAIAAFSRYSHPLQSLAVKSFR